MWFAYGLMWSITCSPSASAWSWWPQKWQWDHQQRTLAGTRAPSWQRVRYCSGRLRLTQTSMSAANKDKHCTQKRACAGAHTHSCDDMWHECACAPIPMLRNMGTCTLMSHVIIGVRAPLFIRFRATTHFPHFTYCTAHSGEERSCVPHVLERRKVVRRHWRSWTSSQ